MEDLIDFSNCKEEINKYKGSEKKKTLIYNNKKYLVKFPDPLRNKKQNISYINNAFSEYIGSKIFEMVGFKTQNTILGKYIINGKEKIVCACEDFTNGNNTLYEFENLTNSNLLDKKVETDIFDIMMIINENEKLIDVRDTIEKFWQMFVIDSLIGNTDRHNGNWGFIEDNKTGKIVFAPIFDCGSCLSPLLEDKDIENMTDAELKNIAFNSYSCLKENSKKINYSQYILNCNNYDLMKAIIYIYPKINIDSINELIESIPCISEIRKNFYKNVINKRYEEILTPAYKKINEIIDENNQEDELEM